MVDLRAVAVAAAAAPSEEPPHVAEDRCKSYPRQRRAMTHVARSAPWPSLHPVEPSNPESVASTTTTRPILLRTASRVKVEASPHKLGSSWESRFCGRACSFPRGAGLARVDASLRRTRPTPPGMSGFCGRGILSSRQSYESSEGLRSWKDKMQSET